MTGPSARMSWLRLALIAAIAVAGCAKSDQVKPDSVAGAGPGPVARSGEDTTPPSLNLDSSAVAQLAARTSFASPRLPVATAETRLTNRNHGVKQASRPSTLTIETASGSSTTGAHLVARIKSVGAYHDLGIESGDNYLDVLKAGSNQWVYLVSMTPFRVKYLTRADPPRPYSHLSPEEPRIVYYEFDSSPGSASKTPDMIAYAFCVEDAVCAPSNQCGYNVF